MDWMRRREGFGGKENFFRFIAVFPDRSGTFSKGVTSVYLTKERAQKEINRS
jgi:hypothetical protein